MLLLDTDVIVDLLREYPPAVKWVTASGEQIVLPGYVVIELIKAAWLDAARAEGRPIPAPKYRAVIYQVPGYAV